MKNKIKIIGVLIICLCFITNLTGCNKSNDDKKIKIISTSFPGYDFARAITKNNKNVSVRMLIKPGSESHTYEPSPRDIIDIETSDVFIYTGGDSDEWISDILNDIDTDKTTVIKLMDLVDLKEEEIVEGMENSEESHEDAEYDEHVWTSPINAIKIINGIESKLENIAPNDKEAFVKNSTQYINKINEIDSEIRDVVSNSKRKELIFGDRFPFRYFVEEYGLSYYAAFPGCSSSTEASANTIAYLVDKVRKDKIPAILHIELSNNKIAKAISNETGVKILELNSAHNISQKNFEAGITYVDIMKKNIKVLKEALN